MKKNSNICIVCESCVLVPYKKEHVERYHKWMESETLRNLTASERLTIQEEYAMQQAWFEDENKCTFIILDKQNYQQSEVGAMIGDVNLFFNDLDNLHSAELEVMIAEETARGKGIGKQAVLAMMIYGIEELGATSYTVKIGVNNKPSIELFMKLGFEEVSRSEVFQEVTQQVDLDSNTLKSLKSKLLQYTVTEYTHTTV